MPNWIEAALAYLKQNTSLRFNMFWLLSWFALLIFVPTQYIDFINLKFLKWDNPYIASGICFVPISYFISYFLKLLMTAISNEFGKIREVSGFKKRTNIISSLNKKELIVIFIYAEIGLDNSLAFDALRDEEIVTLVNQGVLFPIKGCYISDSKCQYRIASDFIKPIEVCILNNERVRQAYKDFK